MHMKRTSLMLDEQLLDEVMQLSHERTYSAAVNGRWTSSCDGCGPAESWNSPARDSGRAIWPICATTHRAGASGRLMVLVDTSAWIAVFRRKSPLRLDAVADLDEIVVCLPVLQEVLQGFRDERAYQIARDALLAFPIVESPLRLAVFEEAATLYRLARRTGRTVRSGVDCLIAACAIRHDLEVLHLYRDCDALAQIAPLRIRPAR